MNEDIAANPSGAARRRCKWLTRLDDLRHEKLAGNHEEIANPGLCSVVGQAEKVGSLVAA